METWTNGNVLAVVTEWGDAPKPRELAGISNAWRAETQSRKGHAGSAVQRLYRLARQLSSCFFACAHICQAEACQPSSTL